MPDPNQDEPRETEAFEAPTDAAPLPRAVSERGLVGWLIAIGALGTLGLVLGQQELAALIACAGLFVAAQAADAEPRWRLLYLALAWIVPVTGAGCFVALGTLLTQAKMAPPWGGILMGYIGWAGIMTVILWYRPVANALVQVLFGGAPTSHTLRLTARLVGTAILISLPAAVVLRNTLEELLKSPENPLDAAGFASSLVGYVALALAGVGFLLVRSPRETLERLGLRPLTPRDWMAAALTVATLVLLTAGADAAQKRWLHDLWVQDQAMSEAIGGSLSVGAALLLGISAGIGEEITMRGALQPRLGLLLTSALFASLHVQYTWFGILVILALGLLLGWVKNRTSTSVVMLAHAAFDVVAVLTS